MKLYYSPGACSLSPHIVLREAGLEFQLEKVDLKTKRTEQGTDYNAINPNGYVPALQVDEATILTEGPAIVQYLADRVPGAKLAPPNGTLERYRLQEVLNFISTEIHKQFSPLFNPQLPADARQAQVDRLARRFDAVEQRLDGRPYLLGDTFSVADAYLFTVLNWAGVVKVDMTKWTRIKEYRKRIAERPAVQAAMKAEGLIK